MLGVNMGRLGAGGNELAAYPTSAARLRHRPTAHAVFVSRETIAKVIDAAPDAEWRLLIALSRFSGLRVPSEALALRWSDVDWEHNRLTVRSPKTEHHEGKGERIIPLFPEIREQLQAVFDAAPVGSVNVIGRYREGANLNPHFRRIIKRAGLTPWDRTWHNLRASRQTELAATFPLHTVCAWIGNTKAIAAGHYLQVTDADWSRATASGEAAANPATQARPSNPTAPKPKTQNPHNPADLMGVVVPCDAVESGPMGRAGLEHPQIPAGILRFRLQAA
jgi:integrase